MPDSPGWRRDFLYSSPYIIWDLILPHNAEHPSKGFMRLCATLDSVDELGSVATHQVFKWSGTDICQDLITLIANDDFLNHVPSRLWIRVAHIG